MPNPSELERLSPTMPRRDVHGLVKAGVSFELSPAEMAALEYRNAARHVCPECQQLQVDLAAQRLLNRQLAERVVALKEIVAAGAERAERRAKPWPPPKMLEP